MASKPKWDTLTRSKKALPRVWDSLTPELRRKLLVGNTFTSFKLWKKLAPKEVVAIQEKLHYKKDVEKICIQLKKFFKEQEASNTQIKNKENTMSSKTKSSSKKSVEASNKKSKSITSNKKSKVVEISADVIKKVDCPHCEVKKGHRCVHTLNSSIKGHEHKKGDKLGRVHRARVQQFLKATKSSKKAA